LEKGFLEFLPLEISVNQSAHPRHIRQENVQLGSK
jgi:hypothetical protein